MRILNKLVSVVLCLVLLSNTAILALAEEPSNNAKDLITYCVPIISNEYTDKTVVFYEHEGKYYLDIEDIKNFTRSTISETDSKIIITHGIRELEIDKSTGHLIDSTVYDQGNIPFLDYEGKYLCEGIPMLMYLGAACTIRDEVALEVLMPSITIWESIMPDYLDYYFNITELYGGEDNVKISLICDILSDVLDGVSGHGLFADGDTHLEDALFEILEVDMMKYASVQEAVATKNQDINDFLSSDAVGTLLEGGSNATDTVSEVLDYYADFYLETEILKNNIRWQHSYDAGDIDSASKLSKQINSQVYEQSSIKANLGTYENLSDILDLGMLAFDTAVTSYSLMQYDDDTKNLFAKTINDEMFDYVGYNEISWTDVSNRISNKLSSNEAIVASTAVENLTEYVAGELAEGGTIQALSAFTSKANIYVAATQIATFVSSLINRDLHEVYSADMNAIWLSAVQYDIARLTTQVLLKAGEEEKFIKVESIEKLKDMLTLYYRTTIAFSENIAVSIDEFGNKNKDEWVKYFSSTTDASVANYAAQYLYKITNCTIVPIVEFNTLDDVVLNSEWIENFESNASLSPEWYSSLIEGYWESKIQSHMLYKFNSDGTVIEYGCLGIPLTEENITNPELTYPHTYTYEVKGDTLTINWGGGTTTLKYVSMSDNYDWDMGIEHRLPQTEKFFYETDFVEDPSLIGGNAFYISRCHDVIDTSKSEDGTYRGAYKKHLANTTTTYGAMPEYTLYDIDKNGIPELIIYDNDDYMDHYIYTYDGEKVVQCIDMDNGTSTVCAYPKALYKYDDGNGIVVHDGGFGSMKAMFAILYTLDGTTLKIEKVLFDNSGAYGLFYEELEKYELIGKYAKSNDYSLLN